MKKLVLLLLLSTFLFTNCQSLNDKNKTDKDVLVEKLQNIEEEVDKKIQELTEQSKVSDGQILKDLEKSLKDLTREKKKIKRSIKSTLAASESEIEDLKKETEKVEKELRLLHENISDQIKKLKRIKDKS